MRAEQPYLNRIIKINNTMGKTEFENAPINNITTGSVITGSISAIGDFRLDGTLKGDMQLTGKLVIGEQGSIEGNIVCQNATVIGKVIGNISVKELLELSATAYVKGDILINRLSIQPGASFSGTCHMLEEVKKNISHTAAPQSTAANA